MKKIAKIFTSVLCLSMVLVLFTGCGEKSEGGSSDNNKKTETKKSKGNYDVFESIEKINTDDTLEDINKLMGFEGKVKSESDETSTLKWKIYRWDLTDDTAIEVRIYDTNKNISIEAIYPNDMISSSKVDFSKVKEEMKKINDKDGLKYEDVKKIVGGVEGTLDKKDSSTLTYVWRNSKGGSFTARFSVSTGKCTSYNGVF